MLGDHFSRVGTYQGFPQEKPLIQKKKKENKFKTAQNSNFFFIFFLFFFGRVMRARYLLCA